tara:strand:- start:4270 stop:5052 length:783 start_codon:yes stop_codon:yes gene_type:complete
LKSKNVVFMPYINLGDNRNESYDLSVKSWKHWCDKNDVDLFVWDDLVFPIERMKITWQRYYLFDILESNEIDYNQVLMVDADTIIHPDTPNFFKETENKYCGVINDGCYEWVSRSIKKYGDYIFADEQKIKPWNYINGGFQIVNKNHKQLFQDIIKFYWENSDKLLHAQKEFKVGTDQTPINYLLKKFNVDLKILPSCYDLQDLFRKNLLYISGYSWWEDKLDNLYNSGWIYHFNAIPQNQYNRDSAYWMKRVFEELYGE